MAAIEFFRSHCYLVIVFVCLSGGKGPVSLMVELWKEPAITQQTVGKRRPKSTKIMVVPNCDDEITEMLIKKEIQHD